jgi:hypothetical protein
MLADVEQGRDDRADHSIIGRRTFLLSVVATASGAVQRAAAQGVVDLGDDAGSSEAIREQRIAELLN